MSYSPRLITRARALAPVLTAVACLSCVTQAFIVPSPPAIEDAAASMAIAGSIAVPSSLVAQITMNISVACPRLTCVFPFGSCCVVFLETVTTTGRKCLSERAYPML